VKILPLVLLVGLLAACTGPAPQPPSAQPSSVAPSDGPACMPEIGESGFTQDDSGSISYGFVVVSHCTLVAINSRVTVMALAADGKPLPGYTQDLLYVPVLLPGQQVALGGSAWSKSRPARIGLSVEGTENAPVTAFAGWPTVTFTGLSHSQPDRTGYTKVSATMVTDPAGVQPCNPVYYLVVRDRTGKIVFGAKSLKGTPQFDEKVPAAVDWDKTGISATLGVGQLALTDLARTKCQKK
jgi:hypothetical protein